MENRFKLRPYQEEDVEFLKHLPCAGCFNEQRTGKTPTALMTLKAKGLDKERNLIVTTSSALYQWQEEYERWLGQPCVVCTGTPKQKEEIIKHWTKGLVISLGSLKPTANRTGALSLILLQHPTSVILDEAHQIRNPTTCAAKAMFKISSKVPIRYALTGTPAYGNPADIFAILKFLYPRAFASIYRFREIYMKPEYIYRRDKYGSLQRITKYNSFLPGKERDLQNFLSTCCTQRKRKEVMKWLPEKDRQIINLPMTEQQQKYLQDLADTFETGDVITKGVLDRLVRYRQICLDPKLIDLESPSPKTEWLLDFLSENPEVPVLIFSNFTQYLRKLFEIFKEKKIKTAMIIGPVNAQTRAKYQKDFQDGKFNAFLINTSSGKEALTLDRAEAIIFTDVYPPIGAIEQAEDRFVSTTEDKADKPHTIYYLAMKDSFDQQLLRLLQQRKTEAEVINNFKAQLERSRDES